MNIGDLEVVNQLLVEFFLHRQNGKCADCGGPLLHPHVLMYFDAPGRDRMVCCGCNAVDDAPGMQANGEFTPNPNKRELSEFRGLFLWDGKVSIGPVRKGARG
jgi:hypothetical protein